jgi:hypothetical protein
MDEVDIKVAVLSLIRRQCRGRELPVIASEFSLNGTGIRADLAILSDTFIGIEIKSAADTLKRLPSQLKGYATYFDNTLLVAAPKHLNAIADLQLKAAEVWSIAASGAMRCQLPGSRNPVPAQALFHLLTQEERRRAIRRNAQESARVVGPPALSDEAARAAFEKTFRDRYGETSHAFWDRVKQRRIQRDDLSYLSRFHAGREQWRQAKEARASHWAHWVVAMDARMEAN